ncbi:DUF3014 domain-containing protein [Porticoccaceae bacterium LTM1]|nr:DUF3014 domain-containing protein [Porticoccaceae bacterium LTM1]
MDNFDNNRPEYSQTSASKRPMQIAILIVAVGLLVIGGWWLMRPSEAPNPEIETVPMEPVQQVEEPEPVVEPEPIKEPVEPTEPTMPAEPAQVLPSLDDSDEYVREEVLALNDAEPVKQWVQASDLIKRSTAVIDGITQGVMLRKFLPVKAPAGKFATQKVGEQYFIDANNYQRYDDVVSLLTKTDPAKAAKSITNLEPLFEEAFAAQGYENRTFKDALIEAIDQILATPIYQEPPELKLESVYFKFSDDSIENMSDAQKQLIRTGPENTQKVQQYLQKLRVELMKM